MTDFYSELWEERKKKAKIPLCLFQCPKCGKIPKILISNVKQVEVCGKKVNVICPTYSLSCCGWARENKYERRIILRWNNHVRALRSFSR